MTSWNSASVANPFAARKTEFCGRCEGLGSPFDEIGTGAMLFLHLFNGTESSAETSDLGEFVLDFLQPTLPLAVSVVG